MLHERSRGDRDSDGRPDRTPEEIQEWAREHQLPYFDEQVHFPDVRIEYENVNGDVRWEDVEVTTEHYRGGHASAAARSMTFGEKPVADITTGDIEAYRHHRRTQKRSAVTINHDLKLLRKMFAWGASASGFFIARPSVVDPGAVFGNPLHRVARNETSVVHSSHQITTATVMSPITNANTRMKPIGGRAPTNLSKSRLDVGDFFLDIDLRRLLYNYRRGRRTEGITRRWLS